MANREHLKVLRSGVWQWNAWRRASGIEAPDLVEADLEGKTFSGADLSWSDLTRANLSRSSLAGCNLQHARLRRTNLEEATLWGTTLRSADLTLAWCERTDFSHADLQCAMLFRTTLRHARFVETNCSAAQAPKNQAERRYRRDNEHLDASAGVDGIEAFYEQCVGNGATILKPLTVTAWGTKDFYIEDPDGYIICFGGRPAARLTSP